MAWSGTEAFPVRHAAVVSCPAVDQVVFFALGDAPCGDQPRANSNQSTCTYVEDLAFCPHQAASSAAHTITGRATGFTSITDDNDLGVSSFHQLEAVDCLDWAGLNSGDPEAFEVRNLEGTIEVEAVSDTTVDLRFQATGLSGTATVPRCTFDGR